jgi:TonB family protein
MCIRLPWLCLIALLCTAFGQETTQTATVDSDPQVPAVQAEGTRSIRSRVLPAYPAIAAKMKITGVVQVRAVVRPDGTVKEVHVTGGHPVLADSVVRAVLKWRFEPGPKETTESVKISFGEE